MKLLNQKSRQCLVMLLLTMLLGLPDILHAQNKVKKIAVVARGPEDFPELVFTNIPGAPKLSKPKLITGRLAPVIGEGMGWASPAVYDWDGDGKKDLLIGEFGSLMEHKGMGSIGNFVRVYKNEGTEKQPAFSGIYRYASARLDKNYYGTPLSVYTWCCLAFTPRFADLDNDGYQDLMTGQKNPGYVTWFRGSEDGFLQGQRLDQAGDPLKVSNDSMSITDTTSSNYWDYSSAAFGDFDGDGDQDMIVGGGALRMSENIGTKTAPKFGVRKLLLDSQDQPLKGASSVPYVTDWDNDGVLDLLVTSPYDLPGEIAITFYRGLKTEKGPRFEKGIALFTVKGGQKSFPGSYPNVCVVDWNNDGVNDLVIGTCVTTIKGKFDHSLSWSWEEEIGTWKMNNTYRSLSMTELIRKQIADLEAAQKKLGWSDAKMRQEGRPTKAGLLASYYGKPEYKDLAHQGYVYVMLGQK